MALDVTLGSKKLWKMQIDLMQLLEYRQAEKALKERILI
jgi:hypothetical protein